MKASGQPVLTTWAGTRTARLCADTFLELPTGSSSWFADNLHGQTTDEFQSVLLQQCNTLLWLLLAGYTDETQPIGAGYGGGLFKAHVGTALDKWLLDADHAELWESTS